MKDCKKCKYAEIIGVGHLDLDIPNCTLNIADWLKCRNNGYDHYVEKEEDMED